MLVVTWTRYPGSYTVDSTIVNNWGEIWVTVVPELIDWVDDRFYTNPVSRARLEQLIGLPNGDGNTHFAEFWVKPDDLFRPSYDNEIDDNTCGTEFPEGTDPAYIEWFNNNIQYSYYPPKYPWTRLGYTYDWGGETEFGLSEFVVKKNSTIVVKSLVGNCGYVNIPCE